MELLSFRSGIPRLTLGMTSYVMKIASWNINSLRKRRQRLLDWLAKGRAGCRLLAGNESAAMINFPSWHSQRQVIAASFTGQKSYNGVAILSRHELREPPGRVVRRKRRSAGPSDRGDDQEMFAFSPFTHRTDRRSARLRSITNCNGSLNCAIASPRRRRSFADADCLRRFQCRAGRS